jgi:predicted transcriptional regulator
MDAVERLATATADLAALATEAERLRCVRTDAVEELVADGWSLQRIADAIGVSKTAVANLRAGHRSTATASRMTTAQKAANVP